MNTGTPPTAPNARTGEFTPPGMTAQARRKSPPDSSPSLIRLPPSWAPAASRADPGPAAGVSHRQLVARVREKLEQPQRVRQLVLPRFTDPVCGPPAVAGRGGHHEAASGVPAQARDRREVVWLTVQVTRPPFVLVGGRTPGGDEEQGPVVRGQRFRGHRHGPGPQPGSLHPAERGGSGHGRHIEHVEDPPSDENDVRRRLLAPPPA